ncbi:hypothetical protein EYZ11_011653 [Aspergillus tanneri]|uniref:Uncharacterized protein n=1 Tax=Aspergillus tanneri TaxID=1220188 RepID=A0A4S3J2A6_9EURO|nr:hypothetical protein EYZ11_011653 [Aspergillus tanneri]
MVMYDPFAIEGGGGEAEKYRQLPRDARDHQTPDFGLHRHFETGIQTSTTPPKWGKLKPLFVAISVSDYVI